MSEHGSWYFTAPWDPVSVRRGDPLGLRAGADYFADLLAPGLSNATSDARWISLLSWCLKWSHIAWQHATPGGRRPISRRERSAGAGTHGFVPFGNFLGGHRALEIRPEDRSASWATKHRALA